MRIALAGNPNVGKSVLFSRLTGIGVISANYPGTTVSFEEGVVTKAGEKIKVFDLPGTYSLAGTTEDEIVATEMLAQERPDYVIDVVDSTRLEQNLVLTLQLIELGYRVVVALNFMDQAKKRFDLDLEKLSRTLRVPVIPMIATTGEGVDKLMTLLLSKSVERSNFVVRYDSHTEMILEDLTLLVPRKSTDFSLRGSLLKLLEGNIYFTQGFSDEVKKRAEEAREGFREGHLEDIEVHIARDRYGEAGKIASEVIRRKERPLTFKDRISDLTLRPATGIPIMLAVLVGIFLSIVLLGGALESLLTSLYISLTQGFFASLESFIGGQLGTAIAQGINLSIEAILAIVVPYILVFYIILGLLEDSGYLPRVVMLLDGIMTKLGLHGRAIIPLVVGTGCNVPSIYATRVLESRRERLILATITVIAVPCSAQTVIIIGTVGKYSGIAWAALIYLILLALILILGRLLHRLLKSEPSSLAIEIPDLSVPKARNVLQKTYLRVKDFFTVAFPLLLVGSIVLELLLIFNVLYQAVDPLSLFTVGLLGLPAVSIIALIFGILRKEMALQILFVIFNLAASQNLALALTPQQLFVFALVMATYMPCLGVLAALVSEFGALDTAKITIASISIALALGAAAHFLFSVF